MGVREGGKEEDIGKQESRKVVGVVSEGGGDRMRERNRDTHRER